MEVVDVLRESAAHDLGAFEELMADYEQEENRTRGDAYQVATIFLAFQAVILTAVAQSTLLTCSLSWSPASLSIAASLAAFLAIAHKLYSIGEIQQDVKDTGLAISSILKQLDFIDDLQDGSTDQLAPAALEPQPLDPRCRRDKMAGLRFILSRDGIFAIFFLAALSFLITSFSIKTLCGRCSRCG